MRTLFPLLALLFSCNPEQAMDPDQEPAHECTEDAHCKLGTICEDHVCIDGDRNSSFEDATELNLESPVDGAINPAGDVNYYSYASAGQEWVRIHTITDNLPDGLNTVISLYNPEQDLHAWMDTYGTGAVAQYDSILQAYLPTAGTWYITVQDRSSFYEEDDLQGDPSFVYSLEVVPFGFLSFEPEEPSDIMTIEVANGLTIWGMGTLLEAPGEIHRLSFDLEMEGPVEVWGMPEIPGSTMNPEVRIYDPDGELVALKEAVGEEGPIEYFGGYEGSWEIELADATEAGGEDAWSVFYLRSRENYRWDRASEDNDSFGEAEVLPTETLQTSTGLIYDAAYVHGTFDPEGDEDWFAVDVADDEYISVRCRASDAGSLGDPGLEIYDGDEQLLETSLDGNGNAPDLINYKGPDDAGLGPGLVHLRLKSLDAFYGPGAYWRCNIFLTDFQIAE